MRAALQKLAGVMEAKCDPEKHEARVTYLASKVKVETMLKAMKDAGFEGKLVKVEPTS